MSEIAMPIDTLRQWHQLVRNKTVGQLDDLLADEVVFYSPVVHSAQVGKAIAAKYLQAALQVFGNDSFHYVRELSGTHDAMLEFELELDGIAINGVDMIRWNDQGRIVEFKVMLRPLKAVNLIHTKMGLMLQAAGPT